MVVAKSLRPALAAVAFAMLLIAPASAETFLSTLDDVPLMPGLAEISGAGIDFEAPTGRIVEAAAQGPLGPALDAAHARDFYAASLPPLGWRADGPGRFVREGEVLTVSPKAAGGRLVVRFSLKPRSNPGRPNP